MSSFLRPSRRHARPVPTRRPRLRVERLESRDTPSTLVYNGPDRRDIVYDATRNLLYITTTAGTIQRYDATAGALLSPFIMPGAAILNGADITPDGTALLATDSVAGATGGFVRRINLATGAITTLSYSLSSLEAGSWDLVAVSDSRALFTTRFNGSGWVPIHEINLTTNAISNLNGVRQDTLISRSADRSRAFFTESNISNGPIFTYSTATNSFDAPGYTDTSLSSALSAVSRNGSLIAIEVAGHTSIISAALGPVEVLGGIDGGMVFDPVRDVLYGVNSTTNELIAFDTITWREKYRQAIGEDVPTSSAHGPGVMAVNPAGTAAYLSTPAGVRRFDLPAATGTAARLVVSDFSPFLPTGTPSTFTVTALDPAGNVATGFTGTVTFSALGGSPVLPGAYTFTAADQGRHTFAATFASAATVTLTATAAGLTAGSQGGITVHTQSSVDHIGVAGRRGMVYDAVRDVLYIATDQGTIERYRPAQRMRLAPWKVGNNLKGIDLTPDGSALLVADGTRGATGVFVRRVDTTTGAVTNLTFSRSGGEGGAWDVAIYNNGRALLTTRYEGSGWTPLRTINVATGAITPRTDVTGVRQDTGLSRGVDRSFGFLTESNSSAGPLHTYRASTDFVTPGIDTGQDLGGRPSAVNRNGSLIALETSSGVSILNSSLGSIITLPAGDGGMAFDPLQDLIYTATSSGNLIRVYNTNTWALVNSFPVGGTIPSGTEFNSENVVVSDDGRWLFVQTTSGVAVHRLVVPTTTTIAATPAGGIVAGQAVTFTATVTGGLLSERVGQTITFRRDGVTIGTGSLNPNGVASLLTTGLPPGSHSVTAHYAGDTGYAASQSAGLTYLVAARPRPTNDFDGDGRSDMAVWRPDAGTWHVTTSVGGFNTADGYARQWGAPGDQVIPAADFDGDGRRDMAVWRPSSNSWYVLPSSSGYSADAGFVRQWGTAGDQLAAADYDGDGRTDMAVWRPSDGTWYILTSASGFTAPLIRQWGISGDQVIPAADFDADGRADMAVWRPSTGLWWVLTSASGFTTALVRQWGVAGDQIVAADFDGDAKADMGIWRPTDGIWWVLTSTSGFTAPLVRQWGMSGDRLVNADYDGDGRTDMAVWRASDRKWYVLTSTSGFSTSLVRQLGEPGDVIIPASDFDGDSKADMAVWRPGTGMWHVLTSGSGFVTELNRHWGVNGDAPIV